MTPAEINAFCDRLRRYGMAGIAIGSLASFAGALLGQTGWMLAFTMLSSTITILLSAYLLFETVLFRYVASFPSVEEGCIALDDWLDRTRLREMPPEVRDLDSRISGTLRIRAHWLISTTITTILLILSLIAETR